MKKIVIALFLVALAAFVINCASSVDKAADVASLRHAPAGDIVGFAEQHETYAWLGIPYAQAPVGELRWRAPRPLSKWEGVREALQYGPVCSQLAMGEDAGIEGSEDCLSLNVWAPRSAASQSKLPVMVFIHGGGNTMGYSSMGQANHLSGDQKVVTVAMNYRLGIFGWLSHPALRLNATAEDASGNFALLDQIAALHWVKDNIAAFGGDPDNITIFGESAGAHDVMMLMASPLAKNLFHRAISQSGSLRTLPLENAENYRSDEVAGARGSSRELINNLLIADGSASDRDAAMAKQQQMSDAQVSEFLRGKSPEQLLAVVSKSIFAMYYAPTCFRDGHVLPREPLMTVFADPARYNSVPVILGTTRDEFKMFMAANPDLVDMRFGFLPRIKDLDTYNRVTAYYADGWKALAVNEPAAILQKSQGDTVFVYRFDWEAQPDYGLIDMRDWLGAAHGLDLPFVIGDGGVTFPWFTSRSLKDENALLTRQMMGYWAAFARDGRPGSGGVEQQPVWPSWTESGAQQLLFDIAGKGGVRVSPDALSAASLKARLREDRHIVSAEHRCEIYTQVFLLGFQADDFWSESEYRDLGCAEFPVAKFLPRL